MKRLSFFLLILIVLPSCAYLQSPQTLDQIRAGWDCIPYEKGMGWEQIAAKLEEPDLAPLPEPGTDLNRFARIYQHKVIIFYTERKEFLEGEKVRFHEVTTDLEVCRKK